MGLRISGYCCPVTRIRQSSSTVCSAAKHAEKNKRTKYAELVLSGSILFMSVAIETFGTWGPSATELCKDNGARASTLSFRRPAFTSGMLSLETRSRLETVSRPDFEVLVLVLVLPADVLVLVLVLRVQVLVLVLVLRVQVLVLILVLRV